MLVDKRIDILAFFRITWKHIGYLPAARRWRRLPLVR